MTEPAALIRALLDHCVTNGTLTDDAWTEFKSQYAMPADQREQVLVQTVQALCRLCADTTAEAHRLSHALARRG